MTAISLEGSDPIIQWVVAIVAGGGMSATIQTATVAARGISSTFTFGVANPVVATGENIASVALALIALLFPILPSWCGVPILPWWRSLRPAPFVCDVAPGEALYIPRGWHHAVESRAAAEQPSSANRVDEKRGEATESVIAVNFWWRPA